MEITDVVVAVICDCGSEIRWLEWSRDPAAAAEIQVRERVITCRVCGQAQRLDQFEADTMLVKFWRNENH